MVHGEWLESGLTSKAFDKRVRPVTSFGPHLLPMPHDVIISHSTAGKLTADAICSELESIGIRCWILPRDLSIGIAWDQSVANAVASCRVMIVVLSDYASRSDRVDRQLEHAFNNGLIIIPFRAEFNSVPSEPQLDSVHWLDAVTPEIAQRLRSLRDLVRGLIPYPQDDSLTGDGLTAGAERDTSPERRRDCRSCQQREKTTDQMPLPAARRCRRTSASDGNNSTARARRWSTESNRRTTDGPHDNRRRALSGYL